MSAAVRSDVAAELERYACVILPEWHKERAGLYSLEEVMELAGLGGYSGGATPQNLVRKEVLDRELQSYFTIDGEVERVEENCLENAMDAVRLVVGEWLVERNALRRSKLDVHQIVPNAVRLVSKRVKSKLGLYRLMLPPENSATHRPMPEMYCSALAGILRQEERLRKGETVSTQRITNTLNLIAACYEKLDPEQRSHVAGDLRRRFAALYDAGAPKSSLRTLLEVQGRYAMGGGLIGAALYAAEQLLLSRLVVRIGMR